MELLLARAGALAATGRLAEGHACLLESLRLVPARSTGLRVALTTSSSALERLLGRHEQAHDRLAGALEELDGRDSPEAVALMLELATDAFYRVQYAPMHDWATRALAAAERVGDRGLIAAATATLALACASAGAVADAQGLCDEAAQHVDGLSDDELSRRLDAATNLATAEVYLDRFAAAGIRCERAIEVGRASGQGELFPLLTVLLGAVELLTGRPAVAAERLDGAVEAARLSGNDHVLAMNHLNRSHAVLALGDVETALSLAKESVELGRGLDDSLLGHWAAEALGSALLESREPERALAVLVGSAGGEDLSSIPGGLRVSALELETRCLLALGRHDDAARVAHRAATAAEAMGLPLGAGMAQRALASVAFGTGDLAAATAHALAAAAATETAGVPIEAALSRTLAGRALAAAGERERALEQLEQAAAELERCGARRWRAEAERELRKLGRHIHRRTAPGAAGGFGVASLTARELEVARCVVDRRTNAEIAAELFLSRKTVETHLRNVFRKLGVSSRVEVARAVERADGSLEGGARTS